MKKQNLELLSGLQLGTMVNRKILSPLEVLDYFEERIAERNPSINAFTYLNFEDARNEAAILEKRILDGEYCGPFAGVPTALKDFLPTKKGWPATHGGVKCLQTIDDADSAFYSAVRDLGAIAVGKTNAPAFGFRGTTDNKMFGPTSTPFKVGYNSGGSSGGSAAAVSDGLVYFAEGGDAGGSIRIPSAWCGCFGFKPSAGVVPSICRPDAWTATHPYCCGGPIARSVEDAEIIFYRMASYDPRDPLSVPIKFENKTTNSEEKITLGMTLNFDVFPTPDPEIVSAMMEIVQALSYSGIYSINVVEFNFHYSPKELEEAWLRGISIDTSIDNELAKRKGFDLIGDHAEDLPEQFVKWNDIAFNSTMMDYRQFHEIRTDILDAHLDVFDNVDVLLAPVCGCLPVSNSSNFDTKGPDNISGVAIDPLIGFGYTYLENMTGFPAASIPIALSSNGLPIGLQVIGKRYEDDKVFKVCKAIEKLTNWNEKYEIPFNRLKPREQ